LIADLRDYRGDRFIGIKTLPVFFGYERAKIIVYLSLTLFLIQILQSVVFPMAIFVVLMIFSVFKDRIEEAHFLGGISLIFLVVWLGINRFYV
jgi:1,4-dihydroxy-2-naphthoate octaprenyltransferase